MNRMVRKRGKRWTIRFVDVHGKERELTVEASSRYQAEKKLALKVAEVSDQKLGIWKGDPNVRFQQLWDKYEPHAKALADWRNIEGRWRVHLAPEFATKKVRQVSPGDIRLFLARKEKDGLSAQSCEHLRMRLVKLYNFAAEEGIYRGENAAARAGAVDVPEVEPRVLPFEIIQGVVDAVPESWRNFFAFAVYTGLRSGELRGLKHEAFSGDLRELRVSRSGSRNRTKTKKTRAVALPQALRPYLENQLELTRGGDWLFLTEEGKQLPRHIKPADILRAAMERLGLVDTWLGWCPRGCKTRERLTKREPWRCPKCQRLGKVQPQAPFVFHDLRKSWETYMHEVVNNPMAVFRMAGHSPEVAMKRYVALMTRQTGALADRLDFRKPSRPAPGVAVLESGTGVQEGVVEVSEVSGKAVE